MAIRLTADLQAEHKLILLSASIADRRRLALSSAASLVGEVDWSKLTEILHQRKLLPTLGPRIVQLAQGLDDADFRIAVEHAIEAGRRQGAYLQLISLRLTTMLAEAGIGSTVLKGPLLAEAIYGDPGRRLSSDIDLLVSADQLSAAVEVVCGLGYEAPSDYVDDSGLPLLHLVLAHERRELPPVELHWRIHWYERAFARERLLPPHDAVPEGWRPDRVDELAALLLFYARDGFVDLRLATDLSAWWDAFGADLRYRALDDLLSSYEALTRVIPAAVSVASKTVGLPAERLVSERYRPDRRSRAAARLANPNPHASQSQLYADMGLIDGLLAPPGGFRAFVRRQLLPPPEVLDEQARHGAKRRARSSLGRCAGVLARYLLTLTRLVRAPQTLP